MVSKNADDERAHAAAMNSDLNLGGANTLQKRVRIGWCEVRLGKKCPHTYMQNLVSDILHVTHLHVHIHVCTLDEENK